MNWLVELSKTVDAQGTTILDALKSKTADGDLKIKIAAAVKTPVRMRTALQGGEFKELPDSDIDFEIESSNHTMGSHAALVPMHSAVAGPRIFYGARFANQALPVLNAEAPLVQSLSDSDPDGRSFDEIFGQYTGARFSKKGGKVKEVTPDYLTIETDDGEEERHELYRNFQLNRKTAINATPLKKVGDRVLPRQVIAKSNYTDDKGTLAMGVNARVGLVPYQGKSMDDAIVISESFAKRLSADQLYGYATDYKRGAKGGKAHYTGIFVNKFNKDQLQNLDEDGVVKPGAIINPGDPLILATRPRVVSSSTSQLGLLSKHMRNARTDAATLWDHNSSGVVTDVEKLKNGVRVNVQTKSPTNVGDKITFRSGQKAIVSEIIPDDRMPRTTDGKPLEVLLNQLGLPSRVNTALLYELLLGKAARKRGEAYKVPTFLPPGQKWYDFVQSELDKNGLKPEEEVFDPGLGVKLENPITVGEGFVQRLHHIAESKLSMRGTGSYTNDMSPAHGGGENAQSKRLSGLESVSLLSSGAYDVLRDAATVRGTKNDDYWRSIRQGQEAKEPGVPFVYDKFRALLQGSGYIARKMGKGQERLQFMTDRDLDAYDPIEVKTGDIVDLATLEPIEKGLFSSALTGSSKWGYISLPSPMVNPAAEPVVLKLLGMTKRQYRDVIAGRAELPPELSKHMKKQHTPSMQHV